MPDRPIASDKDSLNPLIGGIRRGIRHLGKVDLRKRERRLIGKNMVSIAVMPIADVTASLLLAALRKSEAQGEIETTSRARAMAGCVFTCVIATVRTGRNPAADLSGALEKTQVKHVAAITDPRQAGACCE